MSDTNTTAKYVTPNRGSLLEQSSYVQPSGNPRVCCEEVLFIYLLPPIIFDVVYKCWREIEIDGPLPDFNFIPSKQLHDLISF